MDADSQRQAQLCPNYGCDHICRYNPFTILDLTSRRQNSDNAWYAFSNCCLRGNEKKEELYTYFMTGKEKEAQPLQKWDDFTLNLE